MVVDLAWIVSSGAVLFGYIGPGADIGLVSSVIGLLLTLGASTMFLVLMPFRAALRRLKGKTTSRNESKECDAEAST